MNQPRLLTFVGCAALVVIASGCASSKKVEPKPLREITAQTRFEDLRDNLVASIKGATPLSSNGGWVQLMAKTPNQATGAPSTAVADFTNWCQINGGALYLATDTIKPDSITSAKVTSDRLTSLGGLGPEHLARWCDVHGDAYLLEGRHISLGMQGYPAEIRYDGYTFAWLSSQEMKVKTAAANDALAQAAAASAEERRKREQQAQAAEQSRREATARRLAVLERSIRGTQLVCTGRQHNGESIADIWYRCAGQSLGIVTFAEFSQNGWRVSSQTLVPVPLTSGNVEHDATVVFEKMR